MAETMDGHGVAFERYGVSLTRLDLTTIAGGGLAIASLLLPWATVPGSSVSGLEYTWAAPGFAAVAVVSIVLALPSTFPRTRHLVVTLLGVFLALIGIVLLLGMQFGLKPGIGLLVFAVAGFLVTGGGYTALIRETSALKGTAILCGTTLIVVVVGLLAITVS